MCALLLQANTFQAVIATDGQRTFVLFIYGDIEWGNSATIGFNAGDGIRSIVVTTQPLDVATGSNVGVTGLYINRVDLSVILSPSDGEKIKLLHCMFLKICWEYQHTTFYVLSCLITLMCHSFSSVTFGFNQTTYSVREDAGSVTVSVSVISGTISEDVIITLSTAPGGTATGGIIVLRSTAGSIPQQELPCFLNQTPWLLFSFYLV